MRIEGGILDQTPRKPIVTTINEDKKLLEIKVTKLPRLKFLKMARNSRWSSKTDRNKNPPPDLCKHQRRRSTPDIG